MTLLERAQKAVSASQRDVDFRRFQLTESEDTLREAKDIQKDVEMMEAKEELAAITGKAASSDVYKVHSTEGRTFYVQVKPGVSLEEAFDSKETS